MTRPTFRAKVRAIVRSRFTGPVRRRIAAGFGVALFAAALTSSVSVYAQDDAAELAQDPTLVSLSALTGLPQDTLRSLTFDAEGASLNAVQKADAADMEQRLTQWINDMQIVFPALTETTLPQPDGYLEEVESRLEEVRPEEWLLLDALLGDHPGFWQLPGLLQSMEDPGVAAPPWFHAQLGDWQARGAIDGEAAALMRGFDENETRALPQLAAGILAVPTPNATAVAPYPVMPEFPPRGDLPPAPDDRPGCPGSFGSVNCSGCPIFIPSAVIFALQQALTITDAVTASIDPDTEVVIAPACIPAPVPNIAYYVANSIRVALGFTINAMQFNNALADNCVEGLHRGLENLFLDATISSRVTQASLDAHAALQMRIAIENDLLKEPDDHVAIFQLPGSHCSDEVPDDTTTMTGYEGFRFCGQLELARLITDQSVRASIRSDMLTDVNGALAEIAAGDSHYADGEWRSAYQRYSRAYRKTVQKEQR